MIIITIIFLDFTGTIQNFLNLICKIQFIPALLSFNIVMLIVLFLLSMFLGRIYCSTICPLGTLQDIMITLSRNKKKRPFTYYPLSRFLLFIKYSFLVCFSFSLLVGISLIIGLLEPFSVYGKIITQLFTPLYLMINNIFAYFAEKTDSYTFYEVEIWVKSFFILVATLLYFIFIIFLVWRKGRVYCNIICPVGTFFGLLKKIIPYGYKLAINIEKCNKCGLCEAQCKSSCINSDLKRIDEENCVKCFNCISICSRKALTYSMYLNQKKNLSSMDSTRRKFISKSILLMIGLFIASKTHAYNYDGGLAPVENKIAPKRKVRITPPGSISHRHFNRFCTSCHLCISLCPNKVLRPSLKLTNFMQPEMSFEKGYCRPECVKCSSVCPTNAIQSITAEEKSGFQIGYAVFSYDRCVINTDNVNCDRCMTKCPTGAITMVEQLIQDGKIAKLPVVEIERCIGCGACEQLCPARPFSAIYVEGMYIHRKI